MAKVRLGDMATVVTKGTTPTTIGFQFEDSGINFVKIESISEDGTFLKEKFSHISDECNVQMRRSQLQENDILFSIAGAIGRSAIVTKEILPANTNQALAIIRVPKGKIDYNYLLYALSSSAINQQATQHQQGVAQLNISLKNVSDFLLPIYTEAMQKRIVHNLKKIDKLFFLRKQQLSKLDELVKARFVEMFGDPVKNTMDWEIKPLSELGELNRGVSKARPRNSPELLGGPYPLIQTGEVANAKTYITSFNSTYSEKGLAQSKMWPKGTLCITIAANIAQTSILTFDACFPDSVVGFISRNMTNELFIHYWFSFFQKILDEQASQVAQKNINLKILSELNVIVPPLSLQNRFAAFVERVDQQKQTVQQSLEKLELMKKALMQEYFG